ncbi:hypothetical protein AAHE18_06G042800 [Arachis hypogaea]
MNNMQLPLPNQVSNKLDINLEMLSLSMKNWICSEKDRTEIITEYCSQANPQLSRFVNQTISAPQSAKLLNSASVEDLLIVLCFLQVHDKRLVPKNTQKPDTDLRSSRSEAQSASEKP